jgi:thiol-disulfide isomerase/thioredoxin
MSKKKSGSRGPKGGSGGSASQSANSRRGGRSATGADPRLYAWGAVALVVVIVAVFVIVKFAGAPSATAASSTTGLSGINTVASANLVTAVADVPEKVSDEIGTFGYTPSGLNALKGQPPLTEAGRPEVLFFGADFCPYCATIRWAVIEALGRFGTFSHLTIMYSSPNDSSGFDNVPTFSFYHSHYTSRYISFSPYEYENREGQPLQAIPKAVSKLVATYDTNKYVPALSSSGSEDGSIPFLDLSNRWLVAGLPGWLNPQLLIGLPHSAIASALHNPRSPIAQEEDAEANYLTAGICSIDHDRPGTVCDSSGVRAAMKVLSSQPAIG